MKSVLYFIWASMFTVHQYPETINSQTNMMFDEMQEHNALHLNSLPINVCHNWAFIDLACLLH